MKRADASHDSVPIWMKDHLGNAISGLDFVILGIKKREELVELVKSISDQYALHQISLYAASLVLHVCERKYPDNKMPRIALEEKRLWINGEKACSMVNDSELRELEDDYEVRSAVCAIEYAGITNDARMAADVSIFYALDADDVLDEIYTYVHAVLTAGVGHAIKICGRLI